MLRRRLLVEWCTIALLAGAIVAGLLLTRATARIDNAYYDVLVGLRAPPPSDRILIVAIDDASIAAIGRWPWPRTVHAQLLRRLAAAHPAAIAYDVLFTEPGAPRDDAALADALRAARPAGVPVLFETPGRDGRAIDATPPIPAIAAAAGGIGHVALLTDDDGTARAALLAFPVDGKPWPHLMEWAYRATFGHSSPAFARGLSAHDLTVAIPYQPSGGAFRTVSFQSVLAGEVPEAFLRAHVLLVGATAGGLGDRYRVPLRDGGTMPGIEIQANLLNGLMADRTVRDIPTPLRLAAALLPSLLLLVGFWWLRPARALLASGLLIAAALLLPGLLLVGAGLWMPPAPALIGLLIVYPLWGWRRLQAVDRAIGQELAIFAAEPAPVPVVPAEAGLDPIGGHTAELRASIARMRDLRRLVADTIEGVRDPLLVAGLDDRVLLANAPAQALLGPITDGQPLAVLLASLSADARDDEIETRDGRIFSLRRSPLSGGDGGQRGWILLMADISAIRHAEHEREAAIEFLSHDMRSPQAAILALIEQQGSAVPLGERIAGHARRTLALADDFVQLARLGATRFDPEPFNLGDALADAVDEAWPRAVRRGVRIAGEGLDDYHPVIGERPALARALLNLIDNAVKFSPEGGIVRCAIAREGATLACTIEDDGPGLPPGRAADPFARFGATSAIRGERSSGLGLAYVRAAMERHGGTALYEPRLPRGTRFVLSLPALPDDS